MLPCEKCQLLQTALSLGALNAVVMPASAALCADRIIDRVAALTC